MPYIHGKSIIKIAVADDHDMFRELVSTHIDTIENCKVVIQAANGMELLDKIEAKPNTDIVLLDISMPVMNGYDAAKALRKKFSETRILFCSIHNNEMALCRMIGVGGNGCIHKGASSGELRKAFTEVMRNGQYFPFASRKMLDFEEDGTRKNHEKSRDFSQIELRFMQLICSEKTYKQIASDLQITERQVDYLREGLFARFDVHCRVGLALQVHRSGILAEEAA